MDLGFHSLLPKRSVQESPFTSDFERAPEWHSLYPRLCAGWQARRAMLTASAPEMQRSGNFDPVSAHVLARFEHGSRVVNPTASANRKPDGGNHPSLSGDFKSGTRG